VRALEELVGLLTRLPGIGRKSALRVAYPLLKSDGALSEALAEKIRVLKSSISFCSICGSYTESDPCPVCSSPAREKSLVCVVEQPQDVLTIEASREYRGVYHVLGGLISPLDGVGPDDLRMRDLVARVAEGGVTEVVVATNPTVEGDTTIADLLYCVVGPASLRMTTLRAGDVASLLGPLGNGFTVPQGKRTALLVVGGMGLPPIRCLAKLLSTEHKEVETIAFIGARTVAALPLEERPAAFEEGLSLSVPTFATFGVPSMVATDDGSAGHRGPVTESLARWLQENADRDREKLIVYACGPERMLEAVSRIANDRQIACQGSMERRMACGIGLCQSCAIECRVEGSNETVYKLCCQDGPGFDARTVLFGE